MGGLTEVTILPKTSRPHVASGAIGDVLFCEAWHAAETAATIRNIHFVHMMLKVSLWLNGFTRCSPFFSILPSGLFVFSSDCAFDDRSSIHAGGHGASDGRARKRIVSICR